MILPEKVKPTRLIFPYLDCLGRGFKAVITTGWRFSDEPDTWSRRFMRVKAGDKKAVKAGCHLAMASLETLAKLYEKEGLSVGVVSAFGHQQRTYEPDTVPSWLGRAAAVNFGWHFSGKCLAHTPHGALHSQSSLTNREAAVLNSYTVTDLDYDQILIVDDLVTLGSTMKEIARAISVVRPNAQFTGFALGKNERVSWARNYRITLHNGHLSQKMEDIWTEHAK